MIDPGHYSVDYVLMQDSSIHQASSGSSAMAGRQVLEAASRLLYERKQVRISVDRLGPWFAVASRRWTLVSSR